MYVWNLAWRARFQSITPRHHHLLSPLPTPTPSSIYILKPHQSIPLILTSHTKKDFFSLPLFLSVFPCFCSKIIHIYTSMEGLIPFVYKAIVEYKNGKQGSIGSWICDSPSYSYMRLPGDSGRLQFQSSASETTTTTQVMKSSGMQSPRCRLNCHSDWCNGFVIS